MDGPTFPSIVTRPSSVIHPTIVTPGLTQGLLSFKYLCFCLPPMTILYKRLWIIDKLGGISYVCSLILWPCPERFIGIKIKRGIILLVLEKELFECFLETIKAHPEWNK